MSYGIVKLDRIVYTSGGLDANILVSGFVSAVSGVVSGLFPSGTAAAPSVTVGTSSNGLYSPGTDQVSISTSGTERFRFDSTGQLESVSLGTAAAPAFSFTTDPNTGIYSPGADQLAISTNGTGRLSIDANGNVAVDTNTLYVDAANNRVGVGTTTPAARLHVSASGTGTSAGSNIVISARSEASGRDAAIQFADGTTSAYVGMLSGAIYFADAGSTERARIDSSGRLLVGTSSSTNVNIATFQGNSSVSTGTGIVNIALGNTSPGTTDQLGRLQFTDSGHNSAAEIIGQRDGGTWNTSTSRPTRLVFSTTADGASSPTERMRINSGGSVTIGPSTTNFNSPGVALNPETAGQAWFVRDNAYVMYVNRLTSDGDLIQFAQASTIEGTISVSGTTVSYNGAHLSRWSQLPSGAERTEILRGTVLSNIDEMCEWGDEDNEQLNRMKVSDVEGDKNVAGVFQAWDDDDDTYTNDFYCAMTGDFIIRIGAGVTVERGDLLMSAGDGTAKPQDDDIIRSKTVAKVTSTNVSCTYEDGSYCVPCVLMAC